MPNKSKRTSRPIPKKPSVKKDSFIQRIRGRVDAFLQRRPHRSFRLTRRRDYMRSFVMPGYAAFTQEVAQILWKHKRIFALLAIVYAGIGVVLGNTTSQATYDEIGKQFQDGGEGLFEGNWGTIGQAMLLSLAAINGGSQQMTDVQQVYAVLLFLVIWLTTVWLLREIVSGAIPRLRDGLYRALSPLVSTFLVALVLLVQLIPFGVLVVSYTALSGIGVLANGFGAFLFSIIALIVVALTLYWVVSTFIALIVVTLPGMYPIQALRTAGDLVIGRRLRILYRLLWLGLTIVVSWFVIMTPIIVLDTWVREAVSWYSVVSVVPVIAAVVGALSTLWAASYIYLLYRKVVDDDSAPA